MVIFSSFSRLREDVSEIPVVTSCVKVFEVCPSYSVIFDRSQYLKWSVWVNARPFKGGDRLGTDTSFGFHPDEREANLLKPGDHVVIKLSQATKNPG
jgi:hypothetical protein